MKLLGRKKEKEKENSKSSTSFLIKLYSMLNKKKYSKYIHWDEKDDFTFIIFNETMFANFVLPHYFNHKKMASFTRQLNLYNFHTKKTDKKNEHHYTHKRFNKRLTLNEITKIQIEEKLGEDKKPDLTNIQLSEINYSEPKNDIIAKNEIIE